MKSCVLSFPLLTSSSSSSSSSESDMKILYTHRPLLAKMMKDVRVPSIVFSLTFNRGLSLYYKSRVVLSLGEGSLY